MYWHYMMCCSLFPFRPGDVLLQKWTPWWPLCVTSHNPGVKFNCWRFEWGKWHLNQSSSTSGLHFRNSLFSTAWIVCPDVWCASIHCEGAFCCQTPTGQQTSRDWFHCIHLKSPQDFYILPMLKITSLYTVYSPLLSADPRVVFSFVGV